MPKGDQATNPNTNTSPQWQQLANSNISYPTSIVPQQMMGQMRPMMGSQFQRPPMPMMGNNGMMGNVMRGFGNMGMQQQPMNGYGMNPYLQSYGMGQQIGRTFQPLMRSMFPSMAMGNNPNVPSIMPSQSPMPQPTNGIGPNDQQQPRGPQQA